MSTVIAAIAGASLQAPGSSFPWSLVALGVGGVGVLAVGGYLVARFLQRRGSDPMNQREEGP